MQFCVDAMMTAQRRQQYDDEMKPQTTAIAATVAATEQRTQNRAHKISVRTGKEYLPGGYLMGCNY